jgi:glutathione synthase/RimK-type ligase-like ATP-grasp enzyme
MDPVGLPFSHGVRTRMSIDALLQQASSHEREKELDSAEALLRQILSTTPLHREACLKLAEILIRGKRFDEAVAVLEPLANDAQQNSAIYRRLGVAHAYARRESVALDYFERALAFEPDDPLLLHAVANFQQALGRAHDAGATYRRALEVNPFVTIPAAALPPTFRVLFVFAPGAGNTPFEFLIDRAPFESHILSALNDVEYDIDRLRKHAEVVVNLVSSAESGGEILGAVETLTERIGRPVLNPAQRIQQTDRASVSTRLAGTPGCLVPPARRFTRAELLQVLEKDSDASLPYPLVVRPSRTHGGEDFEKMDNGAEFAAYLGNCDSPDYYVTPFVDYRSADGHFRKYRFIFVGDEILPYHLAIDTRWKVHHVTTSMAGSKWMQDEERAFLDAPWCVFSGAQRAALQAIKDAIGLDYFGIDCSLMPDGAIVVFEVNASMLVHNNDKHFPYKTGAVSRIKQAFHSLLERAARASHE